MKRAIFSAAIIFVACLLLQSTVLAAGSKGFGSWGQHPSKTPKAHSLGDILKSGEIVGVVEFCGPQGTNGSVVDLVARSFSAVLGAGGEFNLQYVPAGAYTLRVRIPNQPEHTQPVTVLKRRITDVGLISICKDNDGDGFTPDISDLVTGNDCNDNNASIFPGATEFCDGVDNDCDGNVDGDGCAICSDLDNDGFFAQAGCGTTVDCDDSNNTVRPNGEDICDGVDNNCNGAIDEGFNLNTDPNNCGECSRVCSSGQCGDGVCLNECGNGLVETGEQCDDGNTVDGDGCQADCTLTQLDCSDGTPDGGIRPCDGPDSDQCVNGTQTCTNGVFGECVETVTDIVEVCDGVDNDCDGTTDEDFPNVGQPCTVGIGECVRQGVVVCSGSGTETQCNAVPGTPQAETCNGLDDNCDGQADEGTIAQCDDGNVCTSDSCSSSGGCVNSFLPSGTPCGSGLVCNGNGTCIPDAVCGNNVVEPGEECDDGNTISGDGCQSNCTVCTFNSQCSPRPNSSGVCESGGTCSYNCSNGFADCDGNPQNGCEVPLNTNPVCSTSAAFLGTVSGDTSSPSLNFSGRGERVFRVFVSEDDSSFGSAEDLGARITLDVPSGTNYDLEVRCDSCGGSLRASRISGSANETVFMRWDEETILGLPSGSDSGRNLFVRVIFVSGNVCANWTLQVTGDVLGSSNTCSSK